MITDRFKEISADETHYSEALKYEILGLRQEMVGYMNEQFRVENFSYPAAAAVFAYTFSIGREGPDTITEFATITFLCLLSLLVLLFGYERMRLLRYRISRLGLYILLTEKCHAQRAGWEHFVYLFRKKDMDELYSELKNAFLADDWQTRSFKLNSIVDEIDDYPGRFTKKTYRRWKLIIVIVAIAGIVRSLLSFCNLNWPLSMYSSFWDFRACGLL
ncbi:MAG: hypothetical protein WBC93_17645 [Sulfitobacter sp.]